MKANILEAAFSKGSCIKYWPNGNHRSAEDGFNEAEERGKEKHQESGVCRKKKAHNRTFAKILTHRPWQAGLISREEEKKVSQQGLRNLHRS